MLYSYRVALTGIHLLRTGEVVGDLNRLAPQYGFAEALDLVARYRASSEKACLPPAEDARHRECWPALLAQLEAAEAASPLPPEPPAPQACSDWLTAHRRRDL